MSAPFLDRVSDAAYARLDAVGGDPRELDDPFRTVATVVAAQGVLDDGGLRYFFENDWPGTPPYALFSAAYRTIGAFHEANAIDRAAVLFPFAEPERHVELRREALAGTVGARIEALDGELASNVWALLGAYARAHEDVLLDDAG